jgi:hypothetical protein
MVEIVGRVIPSDIGQSGMKFFLARRITGNDVTSKDGQGRNLPTNRGAAMTPGTRDDTTDRLTGTLSPTGELFDYDLPGSVMQHSNAVNDRFTFDISFEQCIVIGAPPVSGAPMWTTAVNEHSLAVSPIVRWRVNYSATLRAQNLRQIELTLSGSVGAV